MAKKKKEGGIRCLAHRTYLRSGSSKTSVQGIRVDIMGSQKTELSDMAESIAYANTATPADVLAVWGAMEHEIMRALENGRRVSLGRLGTLRLEVGTKPGKSTARSITSKDIEAKGITFTPSKQLAQKLKELTFERPDLELFPNLQHAYTALSQGGNMPCVVNAANEVCVAAFLNDRVKFTDMPKLIERAMQNTPYILAPTLEDYLETDKEVRRTVEEWI